jgi:hypothetical protein
MVICQAVGTSLAVICQRRLSGQNETVLQGRVVVEARLICANDFTMMARGDLEGRMGYDGTRS